MSVPELEVVAEREYHLPDGRPFVVRWMKPIPYLKDWLCVYDFIHPDGFTYRGKGIGIDSAQAFYLALQGVAVNLYQQKAAIYWFEPNDDLGLPVPASMEHIRDGRIELKPTKPELSDAEEAIRSDD